MKKISNAPKRASRHKAELLIKYNGESVTIADFSEPLTVVGVKQLVQTMNMGEEIMKMFGGALPENGDSDPYLQVGIQSPVVLSEDSAAILVVGIRYPKSADEPTDNDFAALAHRFKVMA